MRADQQFYDRHPDVATRWSLIAGRGSFATAPIAAGTQVACFRIPPTAVAHLLRFNHSCEPNLRWSDEHALVAARDVASGDELTLDYATAVVDPGLALFCHCETYRCRQVIEGTDWQIPQLQTRYAGWFAPAVQARIDAAGRA